MVAVNWSGYPNGKIPTAKMVAVEGFYFEPVTAACVRAFMAAARAAGHAISITQGYRALGKSTDRWNTEPVTQWSAWNAMKQGHPLPGASTVATAAPPGTSTHGDGMSADYTGTGWHPETALSKWAETHAIVYGIVFDIPSESWHGHRKFPPQISVAGSGVLIPTDVEEIEVKSYHSEDKTARSASRQVVAGSGFYLVTTAPASASNASNVVGGIGMYSITPHVYATGQPGDSIDLKLIWQATTAKPVTNSAHYIEHLVFGADGQIKASREFKRGVVAGDAVYVRVDAPATNKGPVSVSLLDCDSFLFLA